MEAIEIPIFILILYTIFFILYIFINYQSFTTGPKNTDENDKNYGSFYDFIARLVLLFSAAIMLFEVLSIILLYDYPNNSYVITSDYSYIWDFALIVIFLVLFFRTKIDMSKKDFNNIV